jgi:hypothetical protein
VGDAGNPSDSNTIGSTGAVPIDLSDNIANNIIIHTNVVDLGNDGDFCRNVNRI